MSFSNVLAHDLMIALYNGRVIIPGPQYAVVLGATQDQVDTYIQTEETFSQFTADVQYNIALSRFRFDDQQPIVVGEDTITIAEVPANALFNIVLEPQFVMVND